MFFEVQNTKMCSRKILNDFVIQKDFAILRPRFNDEPAH